MMSPTLEELHQAFQRMLAPVSAAPASHPDPKVPGALPGGANPPPQDLAASPSPSEPPAAAGAPQAQAQVPAAVPAVTAPPPPAPEPCRLVDRPSRGYHLDATVEPGQVVEAARMLDAAGFAIDTVTGVDWMAQAQIEVVYDFFHPASALRVVVRTRVPRDAAEVPTISGVYPGANWHERETHDFFGIRFSGHPDLSPFLLPEDATYHPLRKDFAGAA